MSIGSGIGKQWHPLRIFIREEVLQSRWICRTVAAYRSTFGEKYPKAVATIERRLPMLLTYYQFPASHWKSIRST
ncbi:MAG: transposase, partial [Bradyrhizobiaceae bacterium]|nr:transposase [Bradyrhizobiaceae bacterium]